MQELPSIRSRISWLVLAWAIPTASVFVLLVAQNYARERQHVVNETAQAARAVGAAVERDLGGAEMAADVLADSPALQRDDIEALHTLATRLLRPGLAVSAFIVSDAAGRQLMHTSLPARAAPVALPPKWAASMQRALQDRKPRLTSLPGEPGAAQPDMPQLALNMRLPRKQGGAYVLTALYRPDYLRGLMRELSMPAYLGAAIINADGINVARTLDPQRYVGQCSAAPLLEQMRLAREGMLRHATLEGIDVYTGFRRARDDGWTVAVTMRTSTVLEALLRSVVTGSAILALLLAAAYVLAWRVGGRLARTLQALTRQIQALAQGQPLLAGRQTDRESADMAHALGALERDLRRHRTQLVSLVAERTAALEKSTRLLETVYATAPIGMFFVDLDWRIVMINQYLAAINAASVEQHIGRPVGAMLADAAVRAEVEHCLRQVLQTGQAIVDRELKGNSGRQPGQASHWIVSYHPIFGPEQQLLGVSGLWLDITERKRSEAEFRRSKHLFGTIIENIPAMVFVKRADKLTFEMVNRHAELTLGRSREQLLGKSDHDFFPPHQAGAFVAADRQLLATGQMVEIEQEAINTADGTTRHFTTRKVVLRDDAGRASHVLGVSIDVSERKRATEVLRATTRRLEQSERFIRTVTDNLPGMVSYWGHDLRCRFANKFYNEWFGRSSAELAGIHMSELLGQELFDVYAPHVEGVLAGRAQSFERDLLDPAGRVRHTWTNYIPDFDDSDGVRGFFVLASDVSELKHTELRLHELNEQMVRARDKAEAASIAKSEFVANMSHEIRTPMNAIIGLARLLEESPLERRERSYVGKIQMATQSLLNIVNDVLDFSKIEAGQMVLEQRRFQLERMLASIGVLLASSAWTRGVEPVFVLDPGVPAELVGDALRVEQILINLVGNAVKFTTEGEVVLAIRAVAEDADSVTVEFSVRDTGIGIADAEQEHIFDAFSQGDTSTSRKYGGTGLGLAICRRMVDLMGGSLGVRSTLGKGSDFRFVCRFGRAGAPPGAPPGKAAPAPPAALSVLIIDDNASVRAMREELCAAQGWHSRSAASGQAGLELLRRHGSGVDGVPPADIVLLDAAMPDMDGISMLTEARGDERLALLFQRGGLDLGLAALIQFFLTYPGLLEFFLAGLFGGQRRFPLLLRLLRRARLLLARLFRQFFGRRSGRAFQAFQQGLHGLRPQFRRQRKPVLQHLPLLRVERLRRRWQMAGIARIVERHAPFEHLIDHHGHGIHVQARAGLALVGAGLGRPVTVRARIRHVQRQAAVRIAHARSDAVVEQLDVALRRQEDIARLDVAVHELVLFPGIRQGVGHRLQQFLHGGQGQRARARQIVLEVFAIEAFHDDEIAGRGRVLRPLVDADDVFMREFARLGRFLDQQLGMGGALRQLRRQDLQRHHFAAAQLRVRGQVGRLPHLPHAARADQPLEPVAAVLRADFLARHEAQFRALACGRRRGHRRSAWRRVRGVEDGVLAAFKFLLAEQPVVVEGPQFPQFFSCFLHHLG